MKRSHLTVHGLPEEQKKKKKPNEWRGARPQNIDQSFSDEFDSKEGYVAYFCGRTWKPPGHDKSGAACGFVIYKDGVKIARYAKHLGFDYNNMCAEYMGLICVFLACEKLGIKRIVCASTGRFVVNQMRGKWKVQSDNIVPYFDRCIAESKSLDYVKLCTCGDVDGELDSMIVDCIKSKTDFLNSIKIVDKPV